MNTLQPMSQGTRTKPRYGKSIANSLTWNHSMSGSWVDILFMVAGAALFALWALLLVNVFMVVQFFLGYTETHLDLWAWLNPRNVFGYLLGFVAIAALTAVVRFGVLLLELALVPVFSMFGLPWGDQGMIKAFLVGRVVLTLGYVVLAGYATVQFLGWSGSFTDLTNWLYLGNWLSVIATGFGLFGMLTGKSSKTD